MELIGTIARLQVQRSSLKVGEAPSRRYDPRPLLAVPRLMLTADGVVGHRASGETVADVHHRLHPASKHRGGTNGISIGLTTHYAAMRARFGDHLVDGVAGENILLAAGRMVRPDELRGGLVVEADGRPALLANVIVAAPCVEFSRFALRFPAEARPDRTVTEALRFLGNGMRGYYATSVGPDADIRPGARVYLLPQDHESLAPKNGHTGAR